ncbi:MAG: efflux RND transporter periplasmic adaptor subunit [Proteobacteria bacterium]|nr:efflux RND transporter periplasmic adaptor subunit [Pseudomonadota bacterium]
MALSQHATRTSAKKYFLYLTALSLLCLAAWYFTRPAPLHVQLVTVSRGTVEATVSNTRAGTVKACRRAKLSSPSGGQIAHLLVKKGERVKANQVLLELWNNDFQAQLRLAQEQLITSRTQSVQSCLQAELAEKEFERARQLQAKGFISAEGLDQKTSTARVAHAGCNAAKSQIEQSVSRIAAAHAALDRLVLRAPFDGIVADISGELGEYATPSPPGIPTPPAIDLIDDSCLYVSAPIDEVDAANIKAGQVARITLDAIKGKSFAGRVKRVAPYVLELEKQARTVEVEVDFTDLQPQAGAAESLGVGVGAGRQLPQSAAGLAGSNVSQPPTTENLLAGYSADVEIVHTSHINALRIPTQTLLEGKRVLIYKPDGVLIERTVTTGLANWEQTEITAGLNEGDRIVLNLDQAGVKAGAKVQPETK